MQQLSHLSHNLRAHHLLQRQLTVTHALRQHLTAGEQRLQAAFLRKILTNLRAGTRGANELQPVLTRASILVLRGHNLNRRTRRQDRVQRHQAAVDLRTHRTVTNLAVNSVGEVHGGGAVGQSNRLTIRGEHHNLIRIQSLRQRLVELLRLRVRIRNLSNRLQNTDVHHRRRLSTRLLRVLRRRAITLSNLLTARGSLVAPVRSHTVLSFFVHLVGANLNLKRQVTRTIHSQVQRLVVIILRVLNVVLETASHRRPQGQHVAEHGVALCLFLNHDAHREDVINLIEATALRLHLLMNRIVVLRAASHSRVNAHLFQALHNLSARLIQELLQGRGAFANHAHHLGVNLRAHSGEGQVLQLPLNRVQAQAVRERRVNLQGLFRLLRGRSLRHKTPRTRIVQAVSKLNEQHTNVLAHGQHKLTNRLNGSVLAVRHLVQLGHTINQVGNLLTKIMSQLLHRVVGVLHRVM